MATGNDNPPGGRRRRPPPTIDLRAKEIQSEPPEPTEPLPEPQQQMPDAAPSEAPPEAPNVTASAPEETPLPEQTPEVPTAESPAPEFPTSESPTPEPPTPELHAASETLARDDVAPEPPPVQMDDGASSVPARADRSWPAVLAGLGGAGAMLILFLVLWGFDAFSPDDSVLNAKVTGLEKELRALAARPAGASDPRALNELTARVDAAEQATRRLGDLEARVGRAETATTAERAPAADPVLADRLSELDATVKALNDSLADLRKRAEENSAAMRDTASRAAAAETAARAPDPVARNELDVLAGKLAALESSIKALDDRRAADAGRDRSVRFAITAALLRVAVERGEPYAAELAAVKALAPDPALLRPLEPFAEKGVPSADALARELARITPAMQTAAAAPSREAGLMDRLQANAERLVRIRPANETSGDDTAAVVSRAEAKAQRGDLGGARADLAKLPDPARAPADAWMKQSEARMAAIEAARKLAAISLDALGKAAP